MNVPVSLLYLKKYENTSNVLPVEVKLHFIKHFIRFLRFAFRVTPTDLLAAKLFYPCIYIKALMGLNLKKTEILKYKNKKQVTVQTCV